MFIKKPSSLPLSVGTVMILGPVNPPMVQNAKALGRVLQKSGFLSKVPFPVKTFSVTRQNLVTPPETQPQKYMEVGFVEGCNFICFCLDKKYLLG